MSAYKYETFKKENRVNIMENIMESKSASSIL